MIIWSHCPSPFSLFLSAEQLSVPEHMIFNFLLTMTGLKPQTFGVEMASLPTEPQPLPEQMLVWSKSTAIKLSLT